MSHKPGDLIEVDVETSAFGGASVGRVDNMVVFIPYAVPGDRVIARVFRKKKRFVEARIEKIVRFSADRVTPRCKHFGTCGGCNWQHIAYEKQLEFKRSQVQELFERLAGLHRIPVNRVLGAASPFYYRNKMEFTFGTSRWLEKHEIESGEAVKKDFALGLHIPRRFDKILDIQDCHLQDPLSVEILAEVRETALARGWTAYDTRKHEGFLRNLVLRYGRRTNQLMAIIVTSVESPDRIEFLSQHLIHRFPQISTLVNAINSRRSPVATGEKEITYRGDGHILEEVGNLTLRIGTTSFFQPNTEQAENLYGVIRDLAALDGTETVYDLYCGIGGIGLFLAPGAGKVIGVDSEDSSIRLAQENARRNGISNAEYVAGDVTERLDRNLIGRYGHPDVLILDPPRSGLHPRICRLLLELRPERVVYTSCNPATQARDLKSLEAGYEVEAVQPIDMFPQTFHIESVVALRSKASGD